MLSVCNNVAAIGDYNGRTVYVVSSTGQLGTVNTNLPIRKICVSQSGVVAAVLDDAEVTRILLYNGNENTDTSIVDIKATMESPAPTEFTTFPFGASIPNS